MKLTWRHTVAAEMSSPQLKNTNYLEFLLELGKKEL